jgi:hypothetical protein
VARAELEAALREIDVTARRIQKTNAAMEGDDIDVATLKVLASKIAKDETALVFTCKSK